MTATERLAHVAARIRSPLADYDHWREQRDQAAADELQQWEDEDWCREQDRDNPPRDELAAQGWL